MCNTFTSLGLFLFCERNVLNILLRKRLREDMNYHRSYMHSCELTPENKFRLKRDQLPLDLIVQFAEHCTGIADVMGLNPVQVFTPFSAVKIYDLSDIHLKLLVLSKTDSRYCVLYLTC